MLEQLKKDQIRQVDIQATAPKRESFNAKVPDKKVVQKVMVGSDVRNQEDGPINYDH